MVGGLITAHTGHSVIARLIKKHGHSSCGGYTAHLHRLYLCLVCLGGVVKAFWYTVCHAAGGVQPGLHFISPWCQGPLLTSAWERRLGYVEVFTVYCPKELEEGASETMTFITSI